MASAKFDFSFVFPVHVFLVEMEEEEGDQDSGGLRSLDILCDLLGVSPDSSCGPTEPALPPTKKKRREGETASGIAPSTSGLDLLECSGGNAQDVSQLLPAECAATEKPESRSKPPSKEDTVTPSVLVAGASVVETKEQASGSVCEPSSCSLQSKSGRVCSSLDLFSSSEEENSAPAVTEPTYPLSRVLRLVASYSSGNIRGACFSGCKWSPDGSQLLTCHKDKSTRLFPFPPELATGVPTHQVTMAPVLTMSHGEAIEDFCWYPRMQAQDPVSCRFATCSEDHPVQLWNTNTGHIDCSYKSYPRHHKDKVVAPHSLTFSPDGEKLYCGLRGCVKVFHTCRPGASGTMTHIRSGCWPFFGLATCIAVNPALTHIYAVGSHSCKVAVLSEWSQEVAIALSIPGGCVSQIMFSTEGRRLFTASIMSNLIQCWDLRQPQKPLFVMKRLVRILDVKFNFYSNERYIISGGANGIIHGWDLGTLKFTLERRGDNNCLRTCLNFQAQKEPLCGISVHPTFPLLAATAGPTRQPPSCDLTLWSLLGKGRG